MVASYSVVNGNSSRTKTALYSTAEIMLRNGRFVKMRHRSGATGLPSGISVLIFTTTVDCGVVIALCSRRVAYLTWLRCVI